MYNLLIKAVYLQCQKGNSINLKTKKIMASPKANLEGKKIAKKVMDFIDANSFDPVYDAIEKSEDTDAYIGEILRCVPTGKNDR